MNATLSTIRLLAMDADGVLTDGGLYAGTDEIIMRFNIKDGLGIRRLIESGVRCAVISGRHSRCLENRCRELGIEEYHGAVDDKLSVAEAIVGRMNLDFSQLAYIGDDLPDLPLLRRAGFAAAPADAVAAVRRECDWVSHQDGGRGAVRELSDLILSSRLEG